jgi:hypothetical protein
MCDTTSSHQYHTVEWWQKKGQKQYKTTIMFVSRGKYQIIPMHVNYLKHKVLISPQKCSWFSPVLTNYNSWWKVTSEWVPRALHPTEPNEQGTIHWYNYASDQLKRFRCFIQCLRMHQYLVTSHCTFLDKRKVYWTRFSWPPADLGMISWQECTVVSWISMIQSFAMTFWLFWLDFIYIDRRIDHIPMLQLSVSQGWHTESPMCNRRVQICSSSFENCTKKSFTDATLIQRNNNSCLKSYNMQKVQINDNNLLRSITMAWDYIGPSRLDITVSVHCT